MSSSEGQTKLQPTDSVPKSPRDDTRPVNNWNPLTGKHLKDWNSLRPPIPNVVARSIGGLYFDWNEDSVARAPMEFPIDEEDYDDISEAGSDFTDDYSRHRLEDKFGVWAANRDDDDESLSSGESSFEEMIEVDDWSQSSVSSVDSRQLVQETGWMNSFDEGHLLDDPTEFSIEEDPLVGAHGLLSSFKSPRSDEDQYEHSGMPASSKHPARVQSSSQSLSTTWPISEDSSIDSLPGLFNFSYGDVQTNVVDDDDDDDDDDDEEQSPKGIGSSGQEFAADQSRKSKTPTKERSIERLAPREQDFHDVMTEGRTSPNERVIEKSPKSDEIFAIGQDGMQLATDSQAPTIDPLIVDALVEAQEVNRTFPSSTTKTKMKTKEKLMSMETSDDFDDSQQVQVVASSKNARKKATQRGAKTSKIVPTLSKALKKKNGTVAKKATKKKRATNPIVPTSQAEMERISLTMPPLEDNVASASDTVLDYMADFTCVRFSPIEHREPLKDHSSLRRNGRKSSKKKNKKKSSASIPQETEVAAAVPSDLSFKGDTSEDPVLNRDDQKKGKKNGKKKSKKDKIREGGRRCDYEASASTEDLVDPHKASESTSDLAHRVEAIFSNKQLILGACDDGPDLAISIEPRGIEAQGFGPETTRIRSKASKMNTDPCGDESAKDVKEVVRSVRRSISMGATRVTTKKLRRNRSKSRNPPLLKNVRETGLARKNGDRTRSKSVDDSTLEAVVRRKAKKDNTQTTMVLPAKKEGSSKERSLSRNSKSVKSKASTKSILPTQPSANFTLSDLMQGHPKTPADTTMSRSSSDSSLHEVESLSSFSVSLKGGINRQLRKEPFFSRDGDSVKANIALVADQISRIELQTQHDIKMIRAELDEKKRSLEAKYISGNDGGDAIDSILQLKKSSADDLHTSSLALKKVMESLQNEISTEVSTLSLLSKEAQELGERKTVLLNTIQIYESEIASNRRQLDSCVRECAQMLRLSGEQFLHGSNLVGDFDTNCQDSLIPLFRSWENPFPARRDREEALAASMILPRNSIFFDILNDPEHRLTFYST